jgi:hypothetical protein
LRHVLVGGTPVRAGVRVRGGASRGGDELPHHKATKIIGEVLAEIDTRAV